MSDTFGDNDLRPGPVTGPAGAAYRDTHSKLVQQNAKLTAVIFALCFASAFLLGISAAVAVPGILACMMLSVVALIANPKILWVTFLPMLLVLYALLSAILFGGISSIATSGLVYWLGGEGRFFLYYFPFIFLTLALRRDPDHAMPRIERMLSMLTILAAMAVLLRQGVGIKLYSSHHAAGTVLASLVIFNFFRYRRTATIPNTVFLIMASVALLGTGSRTAVLAVLLGVFIQQLLFLRIGQLVKLALIVPVLAIVMSFVFPRQYERLSNTFNVNPTQVISVNFQRAWQAEPPLESSNAWSLSVLADKQGQANLAIRGLLWARAAVEGSKSPILGAGFGRYNDAGRVFVQPLPLVKVAVEADYNNFSTHSAHNTFLMFFGELGLLGVGLLVGLFTIIIRTVLFVLAKPNCHEDTRMWASICLGCLVVLFLAGITQHSLGAPIFGLTLMQLIAVGYCIAAKEIRS